MTCLAQAQWLPITTPGVIFPNGGSEGLPVARIDKCEVRNHGGATATVTLYIVPSNATAQDYMIRLTKDIAPGVTDLCQAMVGHDLDRGDAVYGMASVADTLSIRISGRYVE